jgi:hypothetical protein
MPKVKSLPSSPIAQIKQRATLRDVQDKFRWKHFPQRPLGVNKEEKNLEENEAHQAHSLEITEITRIKTRSVTFFACPNCEL